MPITAAPPIATATPAATATDQEQQAPPLGQLGLPGGSVVPGLQGSWCYRDACADIIPPDKTDLPAVEAPKSAALTFNLLAPHEFVYWKVDYAADLDVARFTTAAEGGSYVDPDVGRATSPPALTSFAFDPPPTGDWVLAVHVQFAPDMGAGSSVYYWHVEVE